MPAPTHEQAATLQRVLDASKKCHTEEWLTVFADDFTQVTMPFGLGIPTRSRAQVEQILPALIAGVGWPPCRRECAVFYGFQDVLTNTV